MQAEYHAVRLSYSSAMFPKGQNLSSVGIFPMLKSPWAQENRVKEKSYQESGVIKEKRSQDRREWPFNLYHCSAKGSCNIVRLSDTKDQELKIKRVNKYFSF